ncbi:MAG: TonB-dependent receptor [Alphaproteobacteria bacterium PA2]|nr:MAG: TonB-dependent receptor [Alphaproteobacteria bacterium PA2]
MMRRDLLSATAVVALLASGSAYAADAPPEDGKVIAEVIVTGAPYVISLDSATTNVDVVKREDLDTAVPAGIGDVLSGLPGVRSSAFGPGASRPVIRGLSGPRVMVLTNGVGMIDASALSPDHSVATDPQEAERIEVLRGPSALAYGGSAIGGVVNITDNRISNVTVDGLHGRVLGSVSSVDDGKSGSAELRYGAGNWVVTLDGLKRKSSDYTIPMEAISSRLAADEGLPAPQAVESKVVNTAVELTSYGAGLSYVGANGFVGMSVKKLETLYGVPSDEPDPISIDLSQTRIDFRAGLNGDFGPFDRIKLTAGHADYEHVELEAGTPGTRFLSDGWEGRAEFVQPDRDGWQGAVGVQALLRNFDAIGAEVFVPKTRITEQGIFALQRLDKEAWGVEGGLRLDRRELDSVPGKRDFTNVSASAAAFIRPADGWFLALSLARASRAPSEQELFANGAHPAEGVFEIGDGKLDAEISNSVDATIHYSTGPVAIDLHAFVVSYDGFIDLKGTGLDDPDSGFPIYRFTQSKADFHGAELEASYELLDTADTHAEVKLSGDTVRGETGGGPAPRTPPWSLALGLEGRHGPWSGNVEVRQVAKQTRLAAFERATDGYTLVNAQMIYRPSELSGFKIFVDGHNLTNQEVREHVSFLKDIAPLPGRSLRLGIGYSF